MSGHRVFVSHGWSDRSIASQIARLVHDAGASTFIDVFDIAKGDDIEDGIFDAMRSCRELVVLLTPWSTDRNWVWVEIGAARALGLRVVAVLYQISLDAIEREKGGGTFLRAKNCLDLNDFDAYLNELRRRLNDGYEH